jgi:hypothetical protein
MKFKWLIGIFFFMSLYAEAEAVRPPLRPLNGEQFTKMITGADVIAVGTINSVILSKTSAPPSETVMIHATMAAERILKGDKSIKSIVIEETFQQFPAENNEKSVTTQIAGPAPPVGKYRNGDRLLVFLKSLDGSNIYRPLGSGNHDAYLGIFQITADGVRSDRYRFDEELTKYGKSEADFLNFIFSIKGE